MPKNYTYTDAGVNRKQRVESKKGAKKPARNIQVQSLMAASCICHMATFFQSQKTLFLDLVIEGVGTKVLLAQLAQKYDTIGIDAVAMVVNDVIRSGAKPLAIADNIHAQESNPELVKEWLKGIIQGAAESECPVTRGETGDVAEIIKGLTENAGFDMVVASVGKLKDKKS